MRIKAYFFLTLLFLSFQLAPLMGQEEAEGLLEDEFDLEFALEPEEITASKDLTPTSPFRYTLDHGVSYRIGPESALINNRSGVAVEYSSLIAQGYYLKLDLLGNFYWSNDHVAKSEDEDYQAEGFIREAWLQRSFKSSNLKIGYQTIVWNEVEGSLATDLINPVDNREFLFVDYEEARIPQLMLSVSIYGTTIIWEGFINPLPQFNKNPPANSIYYIASPLDDYPIQNSAKAQPEAGLRAQFKLGTSEVALMLARLTPNQIGYAMTKDGLEEVAEPFWMVGASFNYPSGTTLWKGDLGYKTNQGINNQSFELIEKEVVDFAFGLEHGVSEHLWSAILSNSLILGWDDSLILPERMSFVTLGWSKSYLSEDLAFNAGLMGAVGEPMRMFTLLGDYKFDDELSLQSGLFLFSIEDEQSAFYPYRNEHRASLKLSYKL